MFPQHIFKYTQLKVILFSNNIINDIQHENKAKIIIPKEINQLQNLVHLKIQFCNIDTLPNTFFDLKNLQLLDLSQNVIVNLSEDIKKLINLKYLNMVNNRLFNL